MTSTYKEFAIAEVCKVFSGNSINEKEKEKKYVGIQGGVPYIATKDIGFDLQITYENGVRIPEAELEKFKIAPPQTVFICAEGGSAGRKLAISDREVCFVNKLFALVCGDKLLPKYLYYYLQSSAFTKQFRGEISGLIGGVSQSKFKALRILVPDLKTQQNTINKLDEIFKAIDISIANTKINFSNTKALFEKYIDETFLAKGDGWITKKLDEVCVSERGITYGVIKLGDETPNGVPCLRTSNVRWLSIDITGMKRISQALSNEYARTILEGGEVLVNVRGTLGGVAVVGEEMKGWNISREVALVPVNSKLVNSQYVAYFVASNSSQSWLSGVKKGAAYVGINLQDLRMLPISFPTLPAQKLIVEKIQLMHSTINNLSSQYELKLVELQNLKTSVLDKIYKLKEIEAAL